MLSSYGFDAALALGHACCSRQWENNGVVGKLFRRCSGGWVSSDSDIALSWQPVCHLYLSSEVLIICVRLSPDLVSNEWRTIRVLVMRFSVFDGAYQDMHGTSKRILTAIDVIARRFRSRSRTFGIVVVLQLLERLLQMRAYDLTNTRHQFYALRLALLPASSADKRIM